ncbi:hypothetical protein AWC38_SpisGene16105 [Stylophora pistillata]|uniref:Uncharacterized protein n=1 Tax=Stylophora pistillata TaxID=50429 RepID=A0A2B4RRS6_STYPI|nr:hypothetical protein AWC38_SpisGene16105 [Stylophora pistillata]
MNHRLVAFILLVTFVISTRAYFLRTGGKRGALAHKKRSSLWKARSANTRDLKDNLNDMLWSWVEDDSIGDENFNDKEMPE